MENPPEFSNMDLIYLALMHARIMMGVALVHASFVPRTSTSSTVTRHSPSKPSNIYEHSEAAIASIVPFRPIVHDFWKKLAQDG